MVCIQLPVLENKNQWILRMNNFTINYSQPRISNGVDIQWSGERSLTWVKSTLTHRVVSYKKGGLRENFMHQKTYQEVQDHP